MYCRLNVLEMHICGHTYVCKFVVCFFFIRPPERRHGYEQQFHSITAQSEHEALEAKRPRMETIAEAHITRTPPTAGGIVLPITHTVQDSLRATVEVKKVGPVPLFNFFVQNKTFIFFLFVFSLVTGSPYYHWRLPSLWFEVCVCLCTLCKPCTIVLFFTRWSWRKFVVDLDGTI